MSKLPLLEGILKYTKEGNISFCMPGHKQGLGFLETKIGEEFYNNILQLDITEVDGVDNLHHPEGIIKESLELLKNFYGSKKSYFLVNGSTSGNLAMIFSNFKEGDKIIVERNCHRSIFNGIIMRKLKPIYIRNKISKNYGAPMSIDMEHFLSLLKDNSDAKGILITYPNYYGICTDLETIIEEARKYNIKVLVDSAHGAHFGVNKRLPESAVKLGADMVVTSSHKTLPSLTQTAYLHINNIEDMEKADFYVGSFTSTSPSYILMCSMDYARFYLEEYGEKAYEKLINTANRFKDLINELSWLRILEENDLVEETANSEKYHFLDLSRFVISVSRGLSGNKLLSYLRSKGIQCEMSDHRNVVLIFSPFNKEDDFESLSQALRECDPDSLKEQDIDIQQIHIPKSMLLPYEAFEREKVEITIEKVLGHICGKAVVPYPPGVPILNPGELIDETSINMIKYYLEQKATVLGIEDNMLTVVKE